MSEQHFAVMFADIAGSSALYKRVGDSEAKAAIFSALEKMAKLIKRHDGVLVKTIGDEVLCYFPAADLAVLTAKNLQTAFQQPVAHGFMPIKLGLRIGVHWGPAILENQDIFGDAVNTAARMVAAAKEDQIVTTVETVQALNPFLKERCRAFDVVRIKAFPKPIALFLVRWEDDVSSEATHVGTGFMTAQTKVPAEVVMAVHYQKQNFILNPLDEPFFMGRDANQVTLQVNIRCASRRHAWIEFRRGKYVLFDHSTNGTYVQFQGDKEILLKREELPLRGSGTVSLGQHIRVDREHLIQFDCT